jgi:hypothetical protein
MEVRNNNNNPSFGMAFLKPSENLMPKFIEAVYGDKKMTPATMKRMDKAIKQMIEREKSNKNYDIFFTTSGNEKYFGIRKANAAKGNNDVRLYPVSSTPDLSESKLAQEAEDAFFALTEPIEGNFIHRGIQRAKQFIYAVKCEIKSLADETYRLPSALRFSADMADSLNETMIRNTAKLNKIENALK